MNSPRGFIGFPALLAIVAVLVVAGGGTAYFLVHRTTTQQATFSLGVPVSIVPGQSLVRGDDKITFSRFGSYYKEQENGAPITVPEAYLITSTVLSGVEETKEVDLTEGATYHQQDGVAVFPYDITLIELNDANILIRIDKPRSFQVLPVSGPMATIDASSLNAVQGDPVLTGSATIPHMVVYVGVGESLRDYDATVQNGRWSLHTQSLGMPPMEAGEYLVRVMATDAYTELVRGILVVKSSQ